MDKNSTGIARATTTPDVLIGDDGFPVTKVGAWTLEKHQRLVKYVDISRAVRAKFAKTESTYIELFSGPGRSVIEGMGQTIDGSPPVAARTAQVGSPYTDFHLADLDPTFVAAVCKRLPGGIGRIHPYAGTAEATVNSIAAKLNPRGLHFAFLDLYKLDPLPFSIISALAKFRHVDMLIHVSIQDFQRNLRRYIEEEGGPLDRFAPGWRSAVDLRGSDKNVRIGIFNHWLGLIRSLDMAASDGIELVAGTKNQPLYWLVLVARHERRARILAKDSQCQPAGQAFIGAPLPVLRYTCLYLESIWAA